MSKKSGLLTVEQAVSSTQDKAVMTQATGAVFEVVQTVISSIIFDGRKWGIQMPNAVIVADEKTLLDDRGRPLSGKLRQQVLVFLLDFREAKVGDVVSPSSFPQVGPQIQQVQVPVGNETWIFNRDASQGWERVK